MCRMNRYSEGYKIKATIAEFRDKANIWWIDFRRKVERGLARDVFTWEELKTEMRNAFVPLPIRGS